jgi:hypothetical protein
MIPNGISIRFRPGASKPKTLTAESPRADLGLSEDATYIAVLFAKVFEGLLLEAGRFFRKWG